MTNPIVSAIMPDLYAKNTAHMSKAERHSYNYAAIDDYIVEHNGKKSCKQMAADLNEYPDRVLYRFQVLKRRGLIIGRNTRLRLERELSENEHAMLVAYAKYQQAKERLEKADQIKERINTVA